MSDEEIKQFGTVLVDSLFAGSITPKVLLDQYCTLVAPGNAGVKQELGAAWARRNQQRKAEGMPALDPGRPINLSRGYGAMVAEDELKHYLPEEKIMINRDIFRRKLARVDFTTLDANRERGLVEELRQESIGLNKDDTLLYFNLIKLDFLSKRGHGSGGKVQPESSFDYASAIIKQTETLFILDKDSLMKLNTSRPIDMGLVNKIIQDGIKGNRINPAVMCNYLGHNTPKYIEMLKDFIRLVVSQRDGNLTEIFQHFGVYLLLNGTRPELLAKLELTTPLETFVTDKIGRVRQIYYVAMLFAYTMTYVLFVQVYEIASKYEQMPEDQKPKLRKLYESEERLAMLVTNAANVANRKIANYKTESREIQTALKKFLAANKQPVTARDLFGTDYSIR